MDDRPYTAPLRPGGKFRRGDPVDLVRGQGTREDTDKPKDGRIMGILPSGDYNVKVGQSTVKCTEDRIERRKPSAWTDVTVTGSTLGVPYRGQSTHRVRATSGGTPTVYTFGVHETLRLPEMYCEEVPRHHVQAIAILMHMMVERMGTGSALADGQILLVQGIYLRAVLVEDADERKALLDNTLSAMHKDAEIYQLAPMTREALTEEQRLNVAHRDGTWACSELVAAVERGAMDGMEQVATFNALLQRKSWVLDEADWALMAAAMHGHSCYLRPLLAAGATAKRFFGVPGSTGDRFIRDAKEKGRASLVGLTALLVAAERGHHEVVKELVRAGSLEDDSGLIHRAVEVNAGSAVDGTTALMFCVRGAELSRWQQGDVEVVRALLKAGADLEARDAEGSTALIHAAKAGATFAQTHCPSDKFLRECWLLAQGRRSK